MAISTIGIMFQNAALTTTSSQILVTDGSFSLDVVDALAMSGTITFSSLYVTTGAISFNVDPGTSFNAQITVPLSSSNGAPVIEVTNFAGTVLVTWPTATGLQTQTVMSGDPLTLNGFVD